MLSLSLGPWPPRGSGNQAQDVIEGPGGVGSPIGLLLALTKAS